ncbi:hypothetical protein NBRC116583_02380 [Arenicella sp. 4NH20-0111]
MRVHVDPPFRALVEKYQEHQDLNFLSSLVPSKFGLVPCDGVNYYEKRRKSIETYDEALKSFARRSLPEEIYEALESLSHLIFEIKRRRPASREGIKKVFCELCWRKTEWAQSEFSNRQLYENPEGSRRYCHIHTLALDAHEKNKVKKSNWANYIRDIRYRDVFARELELLERGKPQQSTFFPPPVWFIKNDLLTQDEQRKLIYQLVHSGLNKPIRPMIVKCYARGLTIKEIASELSISVPAVYRHLAFIKKKISEIVGQNYLSLESSKPVTHANLSRDTEYRDYLLKNGVVEAEVSPISYGEASTRSHAPCFDKIVKECSESGYLSEA